MTESANLWNYLLPGITLGFAAAVQPGPLLIYLISRTLQSGWNRAFPAIFAPLVTDGPIAVVCLLILHSLPPAFLQYIQVAGGLFLLFLAIQAARSWKREGTSVKTMDKSSRGTFFSATLVNVLNPGPWLGWSLVIGPLFLKGWQERPVYATSLLAGFYLTMFIITALVMLLFHQARERGPKLQRILIGISAIGLGIFGLYQLFTGVTLLMSRS